MYCTNPLQLSLGSLSKIVYQIIFETIIWSQIFYYGVGTQRKKLRTFVFEDRSSLFAAKISTWGFEEIILVERCTDMIYSVLSCSLTKLI